MIFMMMRYIFIFYLCCFCCHNILAQTDKGGFIVPLDSTMFPTNNVIYLPKDGFVFYDKPNGEYAGRISRILPPNIQIPANIPKDLYATVSRRNIRPTVLDLSYFFKTKDNCFYVPFDKQEAGFVRIMPSPLEAWVSVETIKQVGFKLTNWIDFYNIPDKTITIPPHKLLPLLMSPYLDANKIVDLDGKKNYIIKTIPFDSESKSCCEGLFCYVEAIQYKENPCKKRNYSHQNILKIYKGWLKIIDESGDKLIQFNTPECE